MIDEQFVKWAVSVFLQYLGQSTEAVVVQSSPPMPSILSHSAQNKMRYLKIAVSLALISHVASSDPLVEIKTGTLIGTAVEFSHADVDIDRTVNVFRGIPYAEPPVGNLRFRPPQSKTAWHGVHDARDFGPICIQPYNPNLPLDETESEDCLFLNVYAPTTQGEYLPVMVWIHGGAFFTGSGSAKYYSGLALAAIGNVVVVTINYRLGALGFFLTGDNEVSGNYGLLDQMTALQWVQDNIAEFSGDVNKITIFGESAGAISVDFLLLSPLTDGLFHKAILQSGTATIESYPETDAALQNKIAHGLGKVLGCERDTSQELVLCLRAVPADAFRDPSDPATGLIAGEIGEAIDGTPFSPFLDDHFITAKAVDIFRDNAFTRTEVDIMIGNNADEGTFALATSFPHLANETETRLNRSQYEVLFRAFLSGPAKTSTVAQDAVKLMYLDWDTVDSADADYVEALSQMVGDEMFVAPSDVSARGYSESGARVYRYFMTHVPSKSLWRIPWMKAAHGEEIPFVFGYHFLNDLNWALSREEVNMTLKVIKYWTDFARIGTPSTLDGHEEGGEWPAFQIPGLAYKELSLDMESKQALKATECAFWNDYIPKLVQLTESCDTCTSGSQDTTTSKLVIALTVSVLSVICRT
ncbi:acetylcholinesterase-like [Ptychodera flava]|uniref:acetylcholinesterase-like n=1 Tax=Ptychodera flava TaxID=63121 RepID=UPI003969BB4B